MRRRRGIMGLNSGGIPIIAATASGNPLSFVTDMVRPLKRLVIPFTPIQAAGTPSPENPLPISGWTGCNIYNDSQYAELIYFNQIRADSTALVSTDGIKTSVTNGILRIENVSRTSNYSSGSTRNNASPINAIAGHKYAIVGISDKSTTGVGIAINGSKDHFYTLNQIFTPSVSGYIAYRINRTYDFVNTHPIGDVTNVYINIFDITEMFGAGNEPSTFSDFVALFPNEHYVFNSGEYMTISAANGDDHSVNISWSDTAGTVYGGTLTLYEDGSADLISELVAYDIPSSRWSWRSSIQCWYITRSSLSPLPVNIASSNSSFIGYCSACKFDSYVNVANDRVQDAIAFSSESNTNWLICNIGVADSTRPPEMQVVMKLATNASYHFQNVGQLITFLGTNNIWTDTNGTNTATYLKHQS